MNYVASCKKIIKSLKNKIDLSKFELVTEMIIVSTRPGKKRNQESPV
jgi:hypothetical protein